MTIALSMDCIARNAAQVGGQDDTRLASGPKLQHRQSSQATTIADPEQEQPPVLQSKEKHITPEEHEIDLDLRCQIRT